MTYVWIGLGVLGAVAVICLLVYAIALYRFTKMIMSLFLQMVFPRYPRD